MRLFEIVDERWRVLFDEKSVGSGICCILVVVCLFTLVFSATRCNCQSDAGWSNRFLLDESGESGLNS